MCFNFSKFPPKKSQVANEQKNRSVMHGTSRVKKVILGQRVRKVRSNRVHKKKGLIKRKARDHIEYKARETQEHVGHEVPGVRDHVGHEAREAQEHVGHVI